MLIRSALFAALLPIVFLGCVTAPPAPAPAFHDEGAAGSHADHHHDHDHDHDPAAHEDADDDHRSVGHAILMWLPNRVFDVLDIVRARVRIGPGWTLSARATEVFDVNMGAHKSVFVGLHGPRGERIIPWPFGLEVFEGVEVSLADGSNSGEPHAPRYGPLEVGVGLQALIVGFDVGVEVLEVFDFIFGIFFFDPRHDDL